MLSTLLPFRPRHLVAAMLLSAATLPVFALPVMEMQAEDMLPLAAELKTTLNLNANQQTLWQQTESKTRALLRERQARRERLQAASKAGLDAPGVELRDLVGAVDAESATTAAEEKQLREWWLSVNDALSDAQRRVVANLLAEQLLRMPDNGGHSGGAPRAKDEGGERSRGGHHRQGGAGMGMPGG
ncbi:hypothetical protein H3H37_06060 [Duganella sp. LX20W]|uniref:LTXXQ motif family protein n=1 Tax=Rugamonas brunnea TaxID=2758569 RepID=A0A7W2IAZ8_9BURK|nr:hypothetical protein [Rugamonas brunnea]MBA5636615.1 hypothetical protein [Rugamonas brunnea]